MTDEQIAAEMRRRGHSLRRKAALEVFLMERRVPDSMCSWAVTGVRSFMMGA
jgi:hypothetical protein